MESSNLAIAEDRPLQSVRHRFEPVLDFRGGSMSDKWQMAEMLAKSDLVPKDFRGKPGNILIAADLGASLGMSVSQTLLCIAVINGRPTIWGDGLIALVRQHPLCQWIKEHEIGKCTHCKRAITKVSVDENSVPEWRHDATQATQCAFEPDPNSTPEELKKLIAAARKYAECDTSDDSYGYRCIAKRDGDPNVISNEFTVKNARDASLLNKDGPWKTYGARRMCRMRARSWTSRDLFPDTLKGLAMREEMVDVTPAAELREPIVNAASRTEALRVALTANAAAARRRAGAEDDEVPIAEDDLPKTVVDKDTGIEIPVEEKITAALNNAAENDPDFGPQSMKPAELGEYVKAQAEVWNVKPWYVTEIQKATPEGKLVRKNVPAVLRAIRERSLREEFGVPPPAPVQLADANDAPADSSGGTNDDLVENGQQELLPPPDFATMTSEQLKDFVEDAAHAADVPPIRLSIILRSFTENDQVTSDNIGAIIAEIKKATAQS